MGFGSHYTDGGRVLRDLVGKWR